MKKKFLGMISLLSLAIVTLIGATITYATSIYIRSDEPYVFDASTEDFTTFSIGHYFHGGNGSSTYPFLISNPTELRNLSKLHEYGIITTALYYKVANDFSWSGDAIAPIGTPGNPFKGNFDGDNQSIHGINISSSSNYVGLFGVVKGAAITKVTLSAPHITCSYSGTVYAGFICGKCDTTSSTISNSYVYGGTSSLGIRATMTSSSASTTISLVNSTGYLAGSTSNLTVANTSGFINSINSTSPVKTTKTGNVSSISNATKNFYLNNDTEVEIL